MWFFCFGKNIDKAQFLTAKKQKKYGEDSKGDTPVSISNIEVHDLTAIYDCVVGKCLKKLHL